MGARDRAVLLLTSWFGAGYLPKAPGTWGTVASIPVWWAFSFLPFWSGLAATVALVGLAIWLSGLAEKIYGAHDVQRIVIDETAGLLVTVIGVPFRWPQIIAALVLFRVLDMTKPWPIRWVDRNVGGGLGVVLDDVLAGLVACGLLHAARFFWGDWW